MPFGLRLAVLPPPASASNAAGGSVARTAGSAGVNLSRSVMDSGRISCLHSFSRPHRIITYAFLLRFRRESRHPLFADTARLPKSCSRLKVTFQRSSSKKKANGPGWLFLASLVNIGQRVRRLFFPTGALSGFGFDFPPEKALKSVADAFLPGCYPLLAFGGTAFALWGQMVKSRSSYFAPQRLDDRSLFLWQTLIVICCGPPAVR